MRKTPASDGCARLQYAARDEILEFRLPAQVEEKNKGGA